MKIIFLLMLILALLGLWLSYRGLGTPSNDIKLTDMINTFLTAILVIITAYYVWTTAKALEVSRDMALLMKQANQINFRPYLQIEGVQPSQIGAISMKDPKNPSIQPQELTSGFLVVLTPNGVEYLMYGVRNLGQVPAHNIKYSSELFAIDDSDKIERLPLDQTGFTTSETLFPTQINTRQMPLGPSVVFRKDTKVKFVRIKLRISYSGTPDDPNIYYYSVTLRAKPAPNPEALNRGIGGIAFEESDEGIESNSLKSRGQPPAADQHPRT